MPLQILIVEDEVLIAQMIKLYLEEQGHQVQDICISFEEAKAAFENKQPDFVILDIRLYGKKSGVDFARFLQEQPKKTPFIYLTSQHDRLIFDLALETNPYGYLAKPIHKESLWTTVETAYRLFQKGDSSPLKLTLFDGNKTHKVDEGEIVCIKSDHVYASVHMTDGRKIVTRRPLSHFLEQLHSQLLIQCHRSYIINTQYVSNWDNNNNSITLINGLVAPVSRSKKQLLINLLQNDD